MRGDAGVSGFLYRRIGIRRPQGGRAGIVFKTPLFSLTYCDPAGIVFREVTTYSGAHIEVLAYAHFSSIAGSYYFVLNLLSGFWGPAHDKITAANKSYDVHAS
jgi:hypothetical protein